MYQPFGLKVGSAALQGMMSALKPGAMIAPKMPPVREIGTDLSPNRSRRANVDSYPLSFPAQHGCTGRSSGKGYSAGAEFKMTSHLQKLSC